MQVSWKNMGKNNMRMDEYGEDEIIDLEQYEKDQTCNLFIIFSFKYHLLR